MPVIVTLATILLPLLPNAEDHSEIGAGVDFAHLPEERILQFLEENDTPVAGLREGAMVRVENDATVLKGSSGARIFRKGHAPVETRPGEQLDHFFPIINRKRPMKPEGTLILTRHDVGTLLSIGECIAALERVFKLQVEGSTAPPGILVVRK